MDVSPTSGGTVKVENSILSSYPGTLIYQNSASVRIEAVPASGFNFLNWSGDLLSTTNPTNILIDCDKKVTASFNQIEHTLNIKTQGRGSTNPGIGNHSYRDGTEVAISATPDGGWRFDVWTGNVAEPSKAVTTVNMFSDKSLTANFSRSTFRWWLACVIIAAVITIIIVWSAIRSRRV